MNPRVPGRMSWIPGILDSGTSCIVLPDSLLSGVLRQKPFSKFASLFFSDPVRRSGHGPPAAAPRCVRRVLPPGAASRERPPATPSIALGGSY